MSKHALTSIKSFRLGDELRFRFVSCHNVAIALDLIVHGFYPLNGLHPPQRIDLTAKLAKLPRTSPKVREKFATVAAVSTLMLLPSSSGLSFKDETYTIAEQLKCPFVRPSKKTSKKKIASELINGGVLLFWVVTLQSRKRGMNAVRARDRNTNTLGDETKSGG